LRALGIEEGPDKDETEKVLAEKRENLGKRELNERNAIFFSLLYLPLSLPV
jgi:hypothetical protein